MAAPSAPSRTLPVLAGQRFIDPATGLLEPWAVQFLTRIQGTISGSGGISDTLTVVQAGSGGGLPAGGDAATMQRLQEMEDAVASLLARQVQPSPQPYDIAVYFDGQIPANQTIIEIEVRRPLLFPAGLVGSGATLKVAPSSPVSYPLKQNGVGIGSVDCAASATTCTFTFANPVQMAPGDILALDSQTPADTTAAGLRLLLAALRLPTAWPTA